MTSPTSTARHQQVGRRPSSMPVKIKCFFFVAITTAAAAAAYVVVVVFGFVLIFLIV